MKGRTPRFWALLSIIVGCVGFQAHGASYKHWRGSINAANEARIKRDFENARTILESSAAEAAELGPVSSAQNSWLLGRVLYETGQYDEANQIFDHAIERIGNSPSSKELQIWRGSLLSGKAGVAYQLRDFDEALSFAEQAREGVERAAGKYHPELSVLHGIIAKIYEQKKEYAKSEAAYKAALKLAESRQTLVTTEFSGPDEIFYTYQSRDSAAGVLLNMVALGNLYQLQERNIEAEEHYNKALKAAERDCGKKGQAIVIPLSARAQLFHKTNRRPEFETDTQRIYEVAAKGPGIKPWTVYPLWLKLETEVKEEKWVAMEQTAEKIATVFAVQNFEPKVMAEAAQEAATQGNKTDWDRAAKLQSAIRNAAISKFKDPAKVAPILIEFGLAAERGQQTNLARLNYELILKMQEAAADKGLYIASAGKLGEILMAENKPAEALPYYQKVSAGLREKYGDDSRVANAMDREAELLKQLGRTQEATEIAAKANAVRGKAMLKR